MVCQTITGCTFTKSGSYLRRTLIFHLDAPLGNQFFPRNCSTRMLGLCFPSLVTYERNQPFLFLHHTMTVQSEIFIYSHMENGVGLHQKMLATLAQQLSAPPCSIVASVCTASKLYTQNLGFPFPERVDARNFSSCNSTVLAMRCVICVGGCAATSPYTTWPPTGFAKHMAVR